MKKWADRSLMKFPGRNNSKHQHVLRAIQLGSSLAEQGLGLVVCRQRALAPEQVSDVQSCIRQRTARGEVTLPVCSALVRPHLQFPVQFWAFPCERDLEIPEGVSQRATDVIWSICPVRKGWENWVPLVRRGEGSHQCVQILRAWSREDWQTLLSAIFSQFRKF